MPTGRVTDDYCSLSRQWRIAPSLARMVVALEARARDVFSSQGVRWPGLWIISGFRSRTRQTAVNPLAPDSRHTLCPALAVDLRVGNLPASTTPAEIWVVLGNLWKQLGGRWGGEFGDPNHFEAITVQGGPVVLSRAFSRAPQREVTPILLAPTPVVPQRRAASVPFTRPAPIPPRPSLR